MTNITRSKYQTDITWIILETRVHRVHRILLHVDTPSRRPDVSANASGPIVCLTEQYGCSIATSKILAAVENDRKWSNMSV